MIVRFEMFVDVIFVGTICWFVDAYNCDTCNAHLRLDRLLVQFLFLPHLYPMNLSQLEVLMIGREKHFSKPSLFRMNKCNCPDTVHFISLSRAFVAFACNQFLFISPPYQLHTSIIPHTEPYSLPYQICCILTRMTILFAINLSLEINKWINPSVNSVCLGGTWIEVFQVHTESA